MCLWSHTGESLAVFEGHDESVNGVLELNDGTILSESDDGLRILNRTGDELAVLTGYRGEIKETSELNNGDVLFWNNYSNHKMLINLKKDVEHDPSIRNLKKSVLFL